MRSHATTNNLWTQHPSSDLVARIHHLPAAHKVLLDAPHAHEPTEQVRASGLVVGPAGSGAPERLLPHHCAGAFAVDVEIPGRVPQRVLGEADRRAILREDGAGESVVRRPVDELADVGKCVFRTVVVDVEGQDGTEQLGAEERVRGVLGKVDGGVDEVPVRIVVGAADQELQIFVRFGVVNGLGELVERGFMDDGTNKSVKQGWRADFQRFGSGDES